MMPLLAQLAIIFCAFLGGSTAVVAKPLLNDISPILLVSIRFFLSALAIVAIMPRHVLPISKTAMAAGLVSGLGFGAGCCLLYIALAHMQPGRLLFIAGLEVVFVPLICGLLLKTRIRATEKLSIVPAFIGLFLLIGDIGSGSEWDLIAVASAFFYCLYTITLSHIAPASNLASRSFVSFLMISALSFIASFIFENSQNIRLSWYLPLSLFYLVVLGSVGRFVVQAWAQRSVSPTFTAIAFTSEPVFGLAISYMFLGEVMTASQALGAALILSAVVLANWPTPQRKRAKIVPTQPAHGL
jgi:drug/metabolite transporter (DMT)-like permease